MLKETGAAPAAGASVAVKMNAQSARPNLTPPHRKSNADVRNGSRDLNEEWVDRLHDMCRRDDVAFFFKQWGGQNKKAAGRELHGRTYDEFPLELEA